MKSSNGQLQKADIITKCWLFCGRTSKGKTETLEERANLLHTSTWSFLCSQHFIQSPSDILIPEAVNDRVQDRCKDGVDKGHYHVLPRGVVGDRKHVAIDTSSIKETDHCNVGRTGGKGLLLALN
jgi:hypothetical protein